MFINSQFKTGWWNKNRHVQTVWGGIFRFKQQLPDRDRIRFNLDDGDFIDVDIFNGKSGEESKQFVLLLHGLEGGVNSHYIQGMTHKLIKSNKYVGVMNFRGCSGEENRGFRSYHSGVSDDLNIIIKLLAQKGIEVSYLIGFSLGGNVLLKWLGENQGDNKIKAAVAVSVPLLLNECANTMTQGFSKFYSGHLLKTLKEKAKTKKERFPEKITISCAEIEKLNSFWLFDDKITAPLHGFDNALDYYQKSSSRQFLKSIKTPTLIIQAKDDPFMNLNVIPELNELSSNVHFELSENGGHVGFVQGSWPWSAEYYLEKRIPEFFQQFD